MIQPCPVLCLGGPTASGKTDAAIAIAAELGCEIINADSRQVYEDFPIITAQPGEAERCAFPHHLYGFLPTSQKISAGQWIDLARANAEKILARGKIPLLVGGTGLYFQALLRGIAAIPAIDPALTRELGEHMEAYGPEAMHRLLSREDAAYAAKVHPNDRQRILRALEVCLGTGRPFSWWHKNAMAAPPCAGPLAVLDVSLEALAPRLASRIDAMLEAGARKEAIKARHKCRDAIAPGWSGIGCAEMLQYLEGRLSLDECKAKWRANTRAYAKRQITWFRQRRESVFFSPHNIREITAFFREHLKAASFPNRD